MMIFETDLEFSIKCQIKPNKLLKNTDAFIVHYRKSLCNI